MAASRREERIALTRAAWEAYRAGDINAVLRVVHVPVELANTGTYRGHDEFVRWLATRNEAWESYEMRSIDRAALAAARERAALRHDAGA